MYALIEEGGQQFKVSPGDKIQVNKVADSSKKEINLDKVLVANKDEEIFLGKPFLKNVTVKAEVEGNEKSAKVLVYKKKPRKGYKKLRGHRQEYTVLKIKEIVFGGKHGT